MPVLHTERAEFIQIQENQQRYIWEFSKNDVKVGGRALISLFL